MVDIRFSRNVAFALGILTPIAETVRRWSTWREEPAAYFDDFFLGGLLLYGAWRVWQDPRTGQRFLAAGWGFACGMIYPSFFWQLRLIRLGEADPAPISSEWVAVIKGVGFALATVARPQPATAAPGHRAARPNDLLTSVRGGVIVPPFGIVALSHGSRRLSLPRFVLINYRLTGFPRPPPRLRLTSPKENQI